MRIATRIWTDAVAERVRAQVVKEVPRHEQECADRLVERRLRAQRLDV